MAVESFGAHKNPIRHLFRSRSLAPSQDESFLAIDSDRFINVSDISTKALLWPLVTSGDVESATFHSAEVADNSVRNQQMLAVLRKDGVVEFFARPFSTSPKPHVNGETSSQRISKTRKANATLQLVLPNSKTSPAVVNTSLHGPDLVMAIAEGGVDVAFQRVRWQDEGSGELLFEGNKIVAYTRSSSSLNAVTMNGVKDVSNAQMDESHAVVVDAGPEGSSQAAAIAIMSSDVELDDEEDDEEEDEDEEDSGQS